MWLVEPESERPAADLLVAAATEDCRSILDGGLYGSSLTADQYPEPGHETRTLTLLYCAASVASEWDVVRYPSARG